MQLKSIYAQYTKLNFEKNDHNLKVFQILCLKTGKFLLNFTFVIISEIIFVNQ
jgi:hypothetical protein